MTYVTNDNGGLIEIQLNNPEKPISGFTNEVYDKILTYAELDHLMSRLNDIGKVFFNEEGRDFIYITYVYITKLDKDKYVVQVYKPYELISGACIYCSNSDKQNGGFPILWSVKNTINEKSAVLIDIGDWKDIKLVKNKYLEHKRIIDLME